jgi:chromosome segregation ATPase
MNEFNEVKARIEQMTRENEVLKAERQKVLQEMHGLHGKLGENDRTYGEKMSKLSQENKMLSDDVREGQEKLRISSSQTSKLMNEFNEIKARIDQLTRENEVLKAERQKVLQEMHGMHGKLSENDKSYSEKITKLSSENKMLSDDVREGQEKLRISTSQTSKLMNEFTEVKTRIEQMTRENEVLKAERQKVLQEMHGLHGKLGENDRTYGEKINKLSHENKILSDDIREGQEKLRISTSQTSKLMNEFNEIKARIDQLTRENEVLKAERQKVLQEMHGLHGKLGENDRTYGEKMSKLSQENKMLSDDVREGQEKLRISSSQTSKLMNEFNEVKARIEQMTRENEVLKAERQKVLQEMHGLHGKLSENDRSYGEKMSKLSQENKMLSDDVREGQEKLRISTSQTSKLMNEFNEVKTRIETLTR